MSLRPKVLGLRIRQVFVFAFVAGLAVVAAWAVKESARSGLFAWASGAPRWDAPRCVEGLDEAQKSQVLAFAKERLAGLAPAQASAAWREAFPYLERNDVPAWRRLFGAAPCWRFRPRAVLGRVARSRRGDWFLGIDGSLFQAPDALYAGQALPALDVTGASPEDLKALAGFLRRLALEGGPLPRSIGRLAGGEGWRLETSDGLAVLWGGFDFFSEKQKRLAQVRADLQKRGENPEAIDLRYVGSGRVFVRGLAVRSAGERRNLSRS